MKNYKSRASFGVLLGWVGMASGAWAAVPGPADESVVSVSAEARLLEDARGATQRFRDLDRALAAGYGLLHGCVSGPLGGAMGVHYVNPDLVGDGEIDASKPEALIYEWRNGRPQLVGVEYVVIADQWNAGHETPPVLGGQLFNLNSAPNRFGIPAFYELHVWAWKNNPDGAFADWNHKVSCAEYSGSDSHEGH